MPIVTLDSLKGKKPSAQPQRPGASARHSHSDDDHDEDYQEDEGNEYYTGGVGQQGGGSGLAVQAPPSGAGGDGNPLSAALRRAKAAAQGGPVPPANPNRRMATVTVYRDGFTVDGGPFRPLSDPKNKAFAKALGEGFCPQELVVDNQPADVKLDDRHTEAYTPPPRPAYEAFGGQGQAVGEIALSHGFVITAGVEAQGMLVVDETQATVRVQIKYPDGTKEVAKFQPHHTVRHLLALVERNASVNRYQLLTGDRGPPKPLEQSALDLTLTAAGLAGAVVTIRNV